MMKSKKLLFLISVITMLCLCLCLSACDKTNTPADPGQDTEGTEVIVDQKEEEPEQDQEKTEETKTLSPTAQEYVDFCAMSVKEQRAYSKTFASSDAFKEWYDTAKAAYDKENPAIVLEQGEAIDLSGN